MDKNTKILIVLALGAAILLVCGAAFFATGGLNSTKAQESINPSNEWEAILREKGIIEKDSNLTVLRSREVAPGVIALETYEYGSTGWVQYRALYINKETGAHAIVSQYVTSADSIDGESTLEKIDRLLKEDEMNET